MSIFPKRTVRGQSVTIHWNFNIAHLKDVTVFPFVRIGVKDPGGRITMLFEDHVLGLPDPPDLPEEMPDTRLKYLNKNLPLMIISEYLSGKASTERLVEILRNIQSGRHYYFTFQVPKDAPLGRYTLISEVHSQGEIKQSRTAEDDFFLVEKVSASVRYLKGKKNLVLTNHSPEKTPVKITDVHSLPAGKVETSLRLFELAPHQEKILEPHAPVTFLSYSEERIHLPFSDNQDPAYWLRNQQVLELDKAGDRKFLLKKDAEEAYNLTEETRKIWKRANGLHDFNADYTLNREALQELIGESLLKKITYPE